ncbi:30S ribosomal protein S7 [Candidatus Dojkabacteria bacterium]|uniref:Small ribosomal subunit protein uS7 n=1 Tax=Candidatus Dojkabacteria bacterium TaxID=2099670 RepID=A0A3M0Z0L9_9BACT|nr:MAG: 30S ribosomal protein S7 [Candidatus Dojkabacteria bacterium]
MRSKKLKGKIKRSIKPDLVYSSVLVSKLINKVMKDGKKQKSMNIVYAAMQRSASEIKKDPLSVLEVVVENLKPKIEVRSRRVGGANLQVPTPVNPDRQVSLALRWLVEAARKSRKSTEFWISLSKELVSAYNKEGSAYKKKEEVHRMAEANRVFSQFIEQQ